MRKLIQGTVVIFLLALNLPAGAQSENLLTTGDMESEGWTAVPRSTDLVCTFEAGSGFNSTTSLKSVTTNMGVDNYYIIRCEEEFHLDEYDQVTFSFRAKASQDGMRLQSWIQEADGLEFMNIGDAYLTTEWQLYTFTVVISTQTSDLYKFKYRGYQTGTLEIDDVQISYGVFQGVPQSDIYAVSAEQNGAIQSLEVFRHACPEFSLGYQGMVSKDQKPLGLFAGRTINWAKITVDEPVIVQVTITDTDQVPVSGQTVRILPSRYGVTATTTGNVVTFTITEPAQYSVEIGENGYKNGLLIFADPPETDIPAQSNPDYLVLDSATMADVSSIPGNYSGIYFKKGIHDIGVYHIPYNIKNIYFEDGSWVYGSLIMDGKPDVRIFGRGVLSSARLDYRESHSVEAINGSNNITIEGLVVADPKYFAVRLIGQYNNVSYTKIVGGWVYNCDGIAAYKGSTVSKCFIWANDDAIKVYRDSITWSDIVVWVLENGAVIQTSWGGAVGGSTSKGIKISRVDVLRAEWDNPGFASALLSTVGNRYQIPGKSDLLQNWIIEDVVTENPVPLIFKITPDTYTHCHIEGMTLKNWDVKMPMGTSFINQIKGEDPDKFFSGFVFDHVRFNGELLTDINYITGGDMENGGWEAVPGTSNQVVNLAAGIGVDGTTGLKSVVTNMGQEDHYMIKRAQNFKPNRADNVLISFMAKANILGTSLDMGVIDQENSEWVDFGSVSLTGEWSRYNITATSLLDTTVDYQLHFRAHNVNTAIYLDDVKIGPPDWLYQTAMETRYLETPQFLPEYVNPNTAIRNRSFDMNTARIYPNPAANVINIRGVDGDTRIDIYSITGKMVISGKGDRVDVSSLDSGLYMLVTGKGQKMKFMKE